MPSFIQNHHKKPPLHILQDTIHPYSKVQWWDCHNVEILFFSMNMETFKR